MHARFSAQSIHDTNYMMWQKLCAMDSISSTCIRRDNVQNYRLSVHVVHCDEEAHAWVMEWKVKHSLVSRLPMYVRILQKHDKMAIITENITPLAKVKELIHGQGNKALIATTSDRLASRPTKDGRTTDSCSTLIGAHLCGILMVAGWWLE